MSTSNNKFKKWDIVFITRFPDTIPCIKCGRNFSIVKHACDYCSTENHVSNFVAKPRPVLLWIDQVNWYNSMSFAIPLSSNRVTENSDYNHPILIGDFSFSHSDPTYQRPMRAIIHQATRIDGNTLRQDKKIGRLTDTLVQGRIEKKLLKWIFNS